MVGNAHIDPVWLWRWQAGVDEALASFRSAADRCDEYPEFVFTRGESWLYGQVERLDPELFERVRRLVERGQLARDRRSVRAARRQPPDRVMGLRRQLLHGQRYFADRFGVSPTVGYNVDTFGHPATLPDILASEGYVGLRLPPPRREPGGAPCASPSAGAAPAAARCSASASPRAT